MLPRYFDTGLILLVAVAGVANGAVPTDPKDKAAVIGQPTALQVQPASIALSGPRAGQQFVITGKYADGSARDLTPFCELKSEVADLVEVTPEGLVRPRKNGSTALVVKAGGQTVRVPVTVKDFDQPQPVSFRHEVIAALNVGGCNMGACHGTPSGKNGFRLSLRGYDPDADYLQLTRDALGRRTNRMNPESSLILQKPLGRVPHEGGLRFAPDSMALQAIRGWLNEGLREDRADLPEVKRLEILPGSQVLKAPGRWQQLAVLAHFTDGSVRDVTRLTVFSSSENAVAEVTNTGLVEFKEVGEVAILCRYLQMMEAVRLSYLETKPGFAWSNPPEHNYVDKHVFAKLKMLSIQPSDLCTDEEFIRRAYLDVCAILPTPDEVRAFLANIDKDKRAKLIDALLERPEFADFWTLKWMDVLRGSRKTLGIEGVEVYRKWLREHLEKNTPFDQVVRELLTAEGNTFATGPANYYRVVREPQELGETTAQLFFGVRMQCARCHNHPFEKWSQDDYYHLAAFFARVKLKTESGKKPNPKKPEAEIVYLESQGEVQHPRTGKAAPPKLLGGAPIDVAVDADRRVAFAEWLTAPENPFFARSVVNRIWFHLHGRGIVDPVDDFRDSNPPANDELLDALTKDFVEHKFDVKHVIRTIMNSRTYQLSARTNEFNKTDNKYFSHALTRLLSAEQMLDAISSVTEVPEKYAGVPDGTRAVQLPDGEVNHPFLKTFGQPNRELPCECEREGDSNLAQALQLINGTTVHQKLASNKNRLSRLLAKKLSEDESLDELYLSTLARLPCDTERRAAQKFLAKASDPRAAWEDIQWALLNTKEFMFRH